MDKTTNTHRKNDRRLLEMHREIVRQLQVHPGLVRKADQNIRNWIVSYEESGAAVPAVLEEWMRILAEQNVDEIIKLIVSRSQKARYLRQSSPFAGLIDNRVRNKIIESYAD